MLKFHFSLLFFFTALLSFGQSQTLTKSVYFDTGKWHLRADAVAGLLELTDSMKSLQIDSIFLSGNTDSRATNEYNITLSQNRTNQVHKFLNAAGFDHIPVRKDFYGEERPIASNGNDKGMQKNRRVDILVYHTIPAPPVLNDTVKKDPCLKDTVIRLKNGTEVVFNKCEYLDKKDCFELKEVVNASDAIANNMSTVDNEGNPLASGGMIGFNPVISEGCENLCFEHTVTVRFRISGDILCQPCGRGARLYDVDEDGNWEQTDEELGIVEINGVRYYEFELPSCWVGFKNVDCKIPANYVKFKAPMGYDFIGITISNDCPFSVYSFGHKDELRDRIIKKRKIPCYMGNGDIQGYFTDRNGDTLVLNQQPLEDLDKYIWFARCRTKKKEVERKIFGLFPFKKRWLYRKYIIKKDDLVPLE